MELAIYLFGIMTGGFVTVAMATAFQLRRGEAMSESAACRAGCRAAREMTGGRLLERRCRALLGHIQLPDLAGHERLRWVAATSSTPLGCVACLERVKLAINDDRSGPGDPGRPGR